MRNKNAVMLIFLRRDSSVGKALDRRTKSPLIDPWSRHAKIEKKNLTEDIYLFFITSLSLRYQNNRSYKNQRNSDLDKKSD